LIIKRDQIIFFFHLVISSIILSWRYSRGIIKGVPVGNNKRIAPLSKHITIRVTEKEYEKALEYCKDNEISSSEYIRSLMRIHLGLADDLKVLYTVEPRPKKKPSSQKIK
jgi:hypothetical protein